MARLETALGYERVLTQRDIAGLSMRMARLERAGQSRGLQPVPTSAEMWAKVAAAVALPLLVLVVTGSIDSAIKAARLVAP